MKYIVLIIFMLCLGLDSTLANNNPVKEQTVVVDPILPRNRPNLIKRIARKLNPFGKSSRERRIIATRMAAHQQAQQIMRSANAGQYGAIPPMRSSYYGTYGASPSFSGTASTNGGYSKMPPPQSNRSSGTYDKVNAPIYDKVPPIYDKVPPIYDKVPPIYDKVPPLTNQALKASAAGNLLPMQAVMNHRATQKSKTMGSNAMTANQRIQFIADLQKAQKQKLQQKKKANRALRIRQGRELVNYANKKPAKPKILPKNLGKSVGAAPAKPGAPKSGAAPAKPSAPKSKIAPVKPGTSKTAPKTSNSTKSNSTIKRATDKKAANKKSSKKSKKPRSH